MTSNTSYFPALTGFRAIAAWLLFAHHYLPFSEGYIGVSLFFVLSGFLITVRYDDDQTSYLRYIQKRFARIYPLYFILTTLSFFVAGEWGWVYIANITFIKGFIDELKFTGISQGWSLTVEETFYFLAPLIFLAFRRSEPSKPAVIPARSVGIPWKVLLLPLVLVAAATLNDFLLIYTFLGRSFDFFAGIMLAKFFQSKRTVPFATWTGIAGIFLCLLSLTLFRGDHQYGFQSIPGLLVHHLLVPITAAILLYGLVTETTWVQRLLSTRPMQLLGKSSYVFYLVHLGVIATWISGYISSNALILFALLNIVAIALYCTVERPLRQYFLPKN